MRFYLYFYLKTGVTYGALFSLEPDTGDDVSKEAAKPVSSRLFSGVGSDALSAAYGRVKKNFQERIAGLKARRQEYVGGKVKALGDDIKEMETRLEGLNPATRTGRFGLRSLKGVLGRLEHRLESRIGGESKVSVEKAEKAVAETKTPKTDELEVEDA